jgi:uncharacterized protein YkwD
MFRVPRLLLAFLFGAGAVTVHPVVRVMAASGADKAADKTQRATLKPAAANPADIPFRDFDFQAEQQLLEFANQSRARAGVPSLTMDSGLSRAARIHAQAMVEARQLSHQFDGEPSLAQRLAAATHLQLDQEGENVAFDSNPEEGHQHLMLSPLHRANLLNPAYNVVGLGAVRDGDRLYIVEDFGHALPKDSPAEVKDRVGAALNRMRREAGQPQLQRRDLLTADDAACSMAQADKLGTSPIHQLAQRYTVLTYTSLHPETLPAGASQAISKPNLRAFSVGACYARTETYPTGVYWIVLALE